MWCTAFATQWEPRSMTSSSCSTAQVNGQGPAGVVQRPDAHAAVVLPIAVALSRVPVLQFGKADVISPRSEVENVPRIYRRRGRAGGESGKKQGAGGRSRGGGVSFRAATMGEIRRPCRRILLLSEGAAGAFRSRTYLPRFAFGPTFPASLGSSLKGGLGTKGAASSAPTPPLRIFPSGRTL